MNVLRCHFCFIGFLKFCTFYCLELYALESVYQFKELMLDSAVCVIQI